MSEKHTPGPWTLETVRTSVGVCHKIGPFPTGYAHKPESYACVYEDGMSKQIEHHQGRLNSELLANAHLIAAAPDLLAALKALRIDANRLCDRNLGGTYENDCRRSLALADAALQKAESQP